MKTFLIDTHVISELRKARPHGGVVAWMRSLKPVQVFLSAVTIAELQNGAELIRGPDPQRASELDAWIDTLIDGVQLLSMDEGCFREWARLRQHKSDSLLLDAMLAATARVHNLTMATRDEADFRHFDVEIFNPFKFK
jgi:hypothetical protein